MFAVETLPHAMVLKHRKKGTKVTRKPKKHIGVRIRNKIGLDFIKDEWDHTKSPSDNLAAFGLNADPNRTFESSKNALGRKTKPKDPNAPPAKRGRKPKAKDGEEGSSGPKRAKFTNEKPFSDDEDDDFDEARKHARNMQQQVLENAKRAMEEERESGDEDGGDGDVMGGVEFL